MDWSSYNVSKHLTVRVFGSHPVLIGETLRLSPIFRPAGFSQLVNAYPSLAELVKELRIVIIKPYWPMQERVLKRFGIDAQQSEMMPWQSLLKASYPTLTTLRVRVGWVYVSPTFSQSFLKAIKATESLETLALDGDNLPLHHVIQYLPATLKHLSILGRCMWFLPPPGWTPSPHPPCTLQSLTLMPYSWDYIFITCITSVDLTPFNLNALHHLQICTCREFSLPTISRMCSNLCTTLRCLHLSFDRVDCNDRFEHPIRLEELCVLTHLEIMLHRRERTSQVFLVLDWLEESLETFGDLPAEATRRLSTLVFCILFHVHCNFEDQRRNQYDQRVALWESLALLEGVSQELAGKGWGRGTLACPHDLTSSHGSRDEHRRPKTKYFRLFWARRVSLRTVLMDVLVSTPGDHFLGGGWVKKSKENRGFASSDDGGTEESVAGPHLRTARPKTPF
ncbi:hypothetical protein BKA70DRAFT_1241454 [Coprinopsis sp. MPI-PUGE-AT-0042]|nr:hypothetical protein BKA70DRAFT_1241454 [Coprinopsis sp. MPI-PUGE-AT-0042]